MKQDYSTAKARAREQAQRWQMDFGKTSHSWGGSWPTPPRALNDWAAVTVYCGSSGKTG